MLYRMKVESSVEKKGRTRHPKQIKINNEKKIKMKVNKEIINKNLKRN